MDKGKHWVLEYDPDYIQAKEKAKEIIDNYEYCIYDNKYHHITFLINEDVEQNVITEFFKQLDNDLYNVLKHENITVEFRSYSAYQYWYVIDIDYMRNIQSAISIFEKRGELLYFEKKEDSLESTQRIFSLQIHRRKKYVVVHTGDLKEEEIKIFESYDDAYCYLKNKWKVIESKSNI